LNKSIIESSVRDLHTFIVQSNTSIYGDSRATGPFDRDSKDIFKNKIRNKEKPYEPKKPTPEIKKLPARFDNVRIRK
jgi:hypothetical protein